MQTEAPAPWLEGFDAYRSRELDPLLEEMDQSRQRALSKAKGRMIWVIPLVLLAAGLLWVFTQNPMFAVFAGFAGGGLGYAFIKAPFSEHNDLVKRELVTRLARFFDLDFELKPVVTPVGALERLGLVASHHRKSAEDRIFGAYNGVEIDVVELHLEQRRRSKNRTHYVTVFRGPVFVFSFPKRFVGRTVIKSDATAIGNWFGGIFSSAGRVKLADPEFERHFEVYGTDQVEARYLLTPGFMEALLRLRETLKSGVQAAFDGGQLYITANNNQDRFESGGWSQDETMAQQVDRFAQEIGVVFQIIDDLNLRSKTRL
ncbi:MAG: DUF3137 domain-containing protein [Alphaproteobacteria bacterium]